MPWPRLLRLVLHRRCLLRCRLRERQARKENWPTGARPGRPLGTWTFQDGKGSWGVVWGGVGGVIYYFMSVLVCGRFRDRGSEW